MFYRNSIVAVVVALCMSQALAQPGDPYAQDQQAFRQQAYKQARNRFLNSVRMAHSARGCQVINQAMMGVRIVEQLDALRSARQEYLADDSDSSLRDDLLRAADDGEVSATKPNGCDFWHQHPEAVADMRRPIQY
jgi:hypothetical protein